VGAPTLTIFGLLLLITLLTLELLSTGMQIGALQSMPWVMTLTVTTFWESLQYQWLLLEL
jgi:membrane protein CcdC involved in cytochrome C biogenesis